MIRLLIVGRRSLGVHILLLFDLRLIYVLPRASCCVFVCGFIFSQVFLWFVLTITVSQRSRIFGYRQQQIFLGVKEIRTSFSLRPRPFFHPQGSRLGVGRGQRSWKRELEGDGH